MSVESHHHNSQHDGAHTHSDPSQHNHVPSAAERNRAYFSSPSQIYLREKDFFDATAAKWTTEFLSHESWLDLTYKTASDSTSTPGSSLKMLDYACGPGMAGFAGLKLSPTLSNGQHTRFNPVIGVDIAEGMVKLFNERVAASQDEIPTGTTIKAYRGDFVSPEPSSVQDTPSSEAEQHEDPNNTSPAPEFVTEADPNDQLFKSFDLITCIMAVHHFDDPAAALAGLSKRLRAGGVLFVCDMIPGGVDSAEDVWLGRIPVPREAGGHGHGHGHDHGHSHGHGHDHHHDHPNHHQATVQEKDAPREDTGLVHAGFTKVNIEEMFKGAGFVDVKTRLMDMDMVMPESMGQITRKMFWAVGRLAANSK